MRYLTAARAEGDVLVVGVNSDASVRAIKGSNRPVVSEDFRAEVLAGLTCVDFIILFDEPDPFRLIQALMPNVLVKGADWAEDARRWDCAFVCRTAGTRFGMSGGSD